MVDIKDFINNMCNDSKIVYVFDAVHGANVEESKKITLVNTSLLDDVIRILYGMVECFKPEVFPTMSIILYHPELMHTQWELDNAEVQNCTGIPANVGHIISGYMGERKNKRAASFKFMDDLLSQLEKQGVTVYRLAGDYMKEQNKNKEGNN